MDMRRSDFVKENVGSAEGRWSPDIIESMEGRNRCDSTVGLWLGLFEGNKLVGTIVEAKGEADEAKFEMNDFDIPEDNCPKIESDW